MAISFLMITRHTFRSWMTSRTFESRLSPETSNSSVLVSVASIWAVSDMWINSSVTLLCRSQLLG